MTENSSSWQCQCEPAKVLSEVWNLRLPSCSYLTAVDSALQSILQPKNSHLYFLGWVCCDMPCYFCILGAFWSSPRHPFKWNIASLRKQSHYKGTFLPDTWSTHNQLSSSRKGLASWHCKIWVEQWSFLEWFDAVFKKAELCCCFFFFFATSWMKVLYLHRRNVTNKAVGAWSFKILWKEENKFSAEVC